MEIKKVGKKSATAIALLTFALLGSAIGLTADASTKTSRVSQSSQKVARKTTNHKQATAKRTCAKVVAKNTSGENVVYKLNVRSRIYGPVIEQLDDDTTVTVVRRFPNGWVQISQPVQGYVYGEFLTGC
ncbi:SH3 domain-containing protein [Aerosakkonemataceae cyanobacterium BLCC-F154]|uniref:SH3 domain-containing protein n=1 Tax=Floridaenema fluviatile BLCC-F154 TaxID=3153640 RepID=A0ABV4YAZ6_9CYAN